MGLLAIAAIPFGIAMNMFSEARSFIHLSGLKVDAIIKGYEFARAHKIGGGVVGFLFGITESYDCMVLLRLIKLFPRQYPYLGGTTIAKIFFMAIPRSIWPDKPLNVTGIMGMLISHSDKASLVTTIYGEFYANFGMLAIFCIPAAVIAVQRIVRWCARKSELVVPVGIVYGFTFTRMDYSDTLLTLLFTGLIIHGYSVLVAASDRVSSVGEEPADEPVGAR